MPGPGEQLPYLCFSCAFERNIYGSTQVIKPDAVLSILG